MDDLSALMMGGALMLFGGAAGRAWGGRNTERVLLNQCEYLRESLGRATGAPYTPTPGGGKSAPSPKLMDWARGRTGAREEEAA